MRRVAGWGLVVVAVLCLLAGAATAILLGPDDSITSEPQELSTDASVVVTAPGALGWSGPSFEVEARVPDADREIFVGLGNEVDVRDYTEGIGALVVESVDVPVALSTGTVEGAPALPAAPGSLDWWLDSGVGDGTATLSTQLPVAPAQVLVAATDEGPLEGLEVTAAFTLEGGFGIGLGLVGLAVGLALFGWITLRRPPDEWDDWDDEWDDEDWDADQGDDQDGGADDAGEEPVDDDGDGSEPPVRRPTGPGVRRVALARVLGLAVLGLVAAGCAVPRPVDAEPEKAAVTRSEADAVLARWEQQRAEALRELDGEPLTAVEDGPTLAVDQGALTVARRVISEGSQEIDQDLSLRTVVAPRLSAYPLWFLAVVDDGQRQLTKLQIHQRGSAAAPWLVSYTAEVLPQTTLPDLALDDSSALLPVAPDDAEGLPASPQEVARAYAELLDDPASPGDELVLADSFVAQMREIAKAQGTIQGVTFTQSWEAEPVEWAARTADGGALVFATVARSDRYRIKPGVTVDWAEGSEQAAFLSGRTYRDAVLRYQHQVLLYVPPAGGGPVRALGQYGGVVGASGT